MAKRKCAAPATALTEEQRTQLLHLLRNGADMPLAAHGIKVSLTTLKRRITASPELAEAVAEAKSIPDSAVVSRLYSKAMDGDTTAMIFWLKNRRPHEWRDRWQIEGNPDAPIEHRVRQVVLSTGHAVSAAVAGLPAAGATEHGEE